MRLDDRDIEIMRLLSKEGRMTKAELAERINLSATPAWERLRRLEEHGLIEGYHAKISLKALGGHVTIFVAVELEAHKAHDFERFETAMHAYAEVRHCWALGGGYDYFVNVLAKDINAYQEFMDDILARDLGVARYYTYIVTKAVKSSDGFPFELMMRDVE